MKKIKKYIFGEEDKEILQAVRKLIGKTSRVQKMKENDFTEEESILCEKFYEMIEEEKE